MRTRTTNCSRGGDFHLPWRGLLMLFLCALQVVSADTRGKLAGRVTDRENEALVGANVVLVGTTIGAATDLDGYYVALNIPPGLYQVRISMLGFAAHIVSDVRISAGQTTTLDAILQEETIEMKEIVVKAEQPIVDTRQTSSVAILGKDQIEVLPVQELSDIVNLQAGVVDGHFRGGRAGEVQYQVDGVSVNNPYDNTASVRLDRSVLEEVQVISGTFDAEYGQAMSGVVNAILKSGSEDALEWDAEIYGGDYYSPAKSSRFPHISNVRPDAIQNYQLSLSGPTGFFKTTFLVGVRRFMNEGYYVGERRFMPEDRNNFEQFDLHPSGDGAIVPLGWAKEWSGQFKLTNRLIPNVQLSYQAIAGLSESQRYSHMFRINPEGAKHQENISWAHGLDLTHTLSNTLFYTLSVRQNFFRYVDYVYEDVFDARYRTAGRPLGDRNYEFGAFIQGVDLDRFKQRTSSWVLKGSLTSQASRFHLLKAGVELQTSTIAFGPPGFFVATTVGGTQVLVPVLDSEDQPGMRTYEPLTAAAYVQDRIEFEDVLVRIGARAELFDARSEVPSDLQNPANAIRDAPTSTPTATTKKLVVAPRLGISYPVLEGSSLFFSYGHFYQMPGLGDLFRNSNYAILDDLQAGVVDYGVMGNPDLRPEFTTQYEFGFKSEVSDEFGLDLSVYYKDIRDLLGVEFVSTYTAAEYARLTNIDFGDVSGFSIAADFRTGILTTSVDYTYQMAMGNSSDARETATRAEAGEDPVPRRVPLNWDQRHTLNASIILAQPGDFSVTGIIRFGSGQPYTPTVLSRLGANLETNSARKDNAVTVDLRAEKSIRLAGLNINVFARIFNLFEAHAVNGFVFSDTGSPDYTLNVAGNASLLVDPSRYYQPRRMEIGFSLSGSSR